MTNRDVFLLNFRSPLSSAQKQSNGSLRLCSFLSWRKQQRQSHAYDVLKPTNKGQLIMQRIYARNSTFQQKLSAFLSIRCSSVNCSCLFGGFEKCANAKIHYVVDDESDWRKKSLLQFLHFIDWAKGPRKKRSRHKKIRICERKKSHRGDFFATKLCM